MPRAKIDLGDKWEVSLKKRLSESLPEKIEAEPRTELELFNLAIEGSGGQETVSELKRLYSIQFGRILSKKSAEGAIERSVRRILKALLESGFSGKFTRSKEAIRIGKRVRHGRLLYSDIHKAREKVKRLFLDSKEGSLGKHILSVLEKRNFLQYSEIPYPKENVEKSLLPLFEFGILSEKIVPGGPALYDPSRPVAEKPISKEISGRTGGAGKLFFSRAESEFPGARFERNFRFSHFSLDPKKGLVEARLSIDLVAFQPENSTLHLCQFSERLSVQALRSFRERAGLLSLPCYLHLFYPKSDIPAPSSAEKYAVKAGIALHGIKL